MYIGLHVKYPIFLSDFNETLIFSTDFWNDTKIPNFVRIHPVGAKLFEADGWTYRHDEADSSFQDSANMPQKEHQANGQNRLINQEHNSPQKSTSKNLNYWTSTFVVVCGSSNLTSLREEGTVMMQTHPGGHADVQWCFENIKCYHNYEMPS
jgi:hypothetical protein